MNDDAGIEGEDEEVRLDGNSEWPKGTNQEEREAFLRITVDDAGRFVALAALLGMMRQHGAAAGMRKFAKRYRIGLKDSAGPERTLQRVKKGILTAAHQFSDEMDRTVDRGDRLNVSRFGFEQGPPEVLAMMAYSCRNVLLDEWEEAVESFGSPRGGAIPVKEAMSLMVAFQSFWHIGQDLPDLLLAVERVDSAEHLKRENQQLRGDLKAAKAELAQAKGELRAAARLANAAGRTAAEPVRKEGRDEIRALRKENHGLRARIAEMEEELNPEPEEPPEPEPGLFDAEPAEPVLEAAPDPSVVQGKRILVVGGDSKEDVYRDLVEGLGGSYTFMSGFRGRPIAKEDVAGYDGVIFVATQMRHNVFNRVKEHAKALGVPYRILTFKGNETFQTALVECCSTTETA